MYSNCYFIGFNILFWLFAWCLVRTMISDPGKIPLFWGIYPDDSEDKKRRYCLICHIFKPERCHHCSMCGRCVLNMDHHCPWLNNCIGFQNRKFFFLLIVYANIISWYIIGGYFPFAWRIFNGTDHLKLDSLWILIPFFIFLPFSIIIFQFLLFHYQLIARNMTTIENLDRERTNESYDSPSKYDLGFEGNWEYVFGRNKYLWPFPLYGESGKPIGDGVIYHHKTEVKLEQTSSYFHILKDIKQSKFHIFNRNSHRFKQEESKTNEFYGEEQMDDKEQDLKMDKFIPPQINGGQKKGYIGINLSNFYLVKFLSLFMKFKRQINLYIHNQLVYNSGLRQNNLRIQDNQNTFNSETGQYLTHNQSAQYTEPSLMHSGQQIIQDNYRSLIENQGNSLQNDFQSNGQYQQANNNHSQGANYPFSKAGDFSQNYQLDYVPANLQKTQNGSFQGRNLPFTSSFQGRETPFNGSFQGRDQPSGNLIGRELVQSGNFQDREFPSTDHAQNRQFYQNTNIQGQGYLQTNYNIQHFHAKQF